MRIVLTLVQAVMLHVSSSLLGASAIDGFDFDDPISATRYRALISEFRCPKCQNESLASSGAPIASDLRRTVRRLIAEGEPDGSIRSYLQERYGDFVLYDPPFKPSTWLLWMSPFGLFLIAVGILIFNTRNRVAVVMSDDDRERVERLVEESQQ